MSYQSDLKANILDYFLLLVVVVGIATASGCCTLLLIAYTSLRKQKIEIMLTSCEEEKRKVGKRLKTVFEIKNLLIVFLLIGQCLCTASIPFILCKMFTITQAILLAVLILLIFGLIGPRMFCQPSQLFKIANTSSCLLIFLRNLNRCLPFQNCLSFILRRKQKQAEICRENISSVLHLHQNLKYGYRPEEIQILQNIMKVKSIAVDSLIIKIDYVFMVSLTSIVNQAFIKNLSKYYFTKAIVYEGSRSNVIGYVQIKKLLLFDLEKNQTIKSKINEVVQKNIVILKSGDTLLQGLKQMQTNQINFALIYDDEAEDYIGIIKLRDIFKKLVFKWYDYNTLRPDLAVKSKSSTFSKQRKRCELVQGSEQN